jgi:beta-lactamase class A
MVKYTAVSKKKLILIVGVALIVVVGSFLLGKYTTKTSTATTGSQNSSSEEYNLLAKRIFLDNPNDTKINFSPLRQKLNQYFEQNKLSGGNLYFEYLPTGTSIRISGEEQLVAASLMKVPAAMDMYKANELGRLNIDNKTALQASWLNDEYGSLYKKGAGYQISPRDAAKIMLEQSDNTALAVVGDAIKGKLTDSESSINYLDLDMKVNGDGSISMNARGYSSILKCLYFACYNTKADSQTMLEQLTNSIYTSRIPAGIADKNIKVAHKIGTNFNNNQNDCGIIYYPKNNYLLCVMIPGNESEQTDQHIANISKIVYDFINTGK